MTKLKFNKAIIGVILLTALAPWGVSAQATSTRIKFNDFCNSVTIIEARLLQQFEDKQVEIQASRAAKEAENANNRAANDLKISEKRNVWEQNLAVRINLIEAKISSSTSASKETQLLALANFKAAMDSSRQIKESAVDLALQNFRNGVDNTISLRKTQVDEAKLAYESAIKVAIEKSKEDCAAKVGPRTIKESLNQRVAAARAAFRNAVSEINRSGEAIKVLAAAKNEAIKSAQTTYKTDYEAALKTLKASLLRN